MSSFKTYLRESTADKGILKAVLILGIAGAGKTKFTNEIKNNFSTYPFTAVDVDKYTEHLVGHKTRSGPLADFKELLKKYDPSINQLSPEQHQFIQKIARKRGRQMFTKFFEQQLNGLLPILASAVGDDYDKIVERIKLLQSVGYDVGVVLLDADLGHSLVTTTIRSRHVDDKVIVKQHEEYQKNLKKYEQLPVTFVETVRVNADEKNHAFHQGDVSTVFKQVRKLLESPVQNEIGEDRLNQLKEIGGKYLSDVVPAAELQALAGSWYSKKS